MSTPQAPQQEQQQQDPTPIFRALQAQRNAALDNLADASAALEASQAQFKGAVEHIQKQQSQIDDLATQLDATKAALDELQALNSKLDASNVDLMRELNEFRPAAAPV